MLKRRGPRIPFHGIADRQPYIRPATAHASDATGASRGTQNRERPMATSAARHTVNPAAVIICIANGGEALGASPF